MIKVFAPAFFARKDTKSPVIFAIIAMVVNVSLNLLLYKPFGHVGLAMATSASAWVNVLLLYIYLKKRDYFIGDNLLVTRIGKSLVATAGLGVTTYYLSAWATPLIHAGNWDKALGLSVMILASMVVYFSLSALLRIFPRAEIMGFMKRGS